MIFVTGFGKTGHVHTRIEIHFIAYYNGHTQALSRHSDTISIDKKVCFYRRLLPTLSSHAGPSQPLWDHWRALIGWAVVTNCSTWRLVWSGWMEEVGGLVNNASRYSQPSCVHRGPDRWPQHPHPPHPLIHGTHDIAGFVQNLSKSASPSSSYTS